MTPDTHNLHGKTEGAEEEDRPVKLHKIKTGASAHSHARKQSAGGLYRSLTQDSGLFAQRRASRYQRDSDDEEDGPILSKAENWALMPEVKLQAEGHEKDGLLGRKLGVTWNNLNVRGVASGGVIQASPPSSSFQSTATNV